jgi:hypothetical protein
MKAKAHTAMVAGASSCVVASWIRSRTTSKFDPLADTPCRSELIARRLPMVAAGIGFTGLSATVSGYFDTAELKVLSDSADVRPLHQRLELHRELHSLPFLGEALTTAHLLRYGAQHFGQWLAARLEVSDRTAAVINALEGLSEWVINAVGTGIFGHVLGDVPTKGKGGTALQLLKPFTEHNFSLGWVSATSKSANKYLTLAGTALTGAAWALAGVHVFCWKPPEKHLDSYLERLSKAESVTAAASMIHDDIVELFERIFNRIKGSLFDNSEFSGPLARDVNSETSWIHTSHDPQASCGVGSFSPQSLYQEGILPERILELKDGSALYSVETLWEGRGSLVSSEPGTGEHRLQKDSSDTPLESSDQDGKSLFDESD